MRKSIVIVGSGIVGASIAYHLALRQADVTVVDAGDLGGVATAASWAWINASAGNPEPYARLRMHAMRLWYELGTTLPALDVRWTGGLMWDLSPQKLAAYEAQHAEWDYPVRLVDRAEAARLEPDLAEPPALAAHVEVEGSVEPRQAARALLNEAVARGASVLPRLRVDRLCLSADRGRVTGVDTGSGRIRADEVVVACGTGTPHLLGTARVRLPLSAPPGLLVVTRPMRRVLSGLVMAPGLHMRQRRDGSLIAGADFGGSDPGEDADAAARSCLAAMRRLLRSGRDLEFDHFTLGRRPTPVDGFPAIGRPSGVAGLYVAVTHSGVTLAPAIGAFAADEILDGYRDEMLERFGLERFDRGISAEP